MGEPVAFGFQLYSRSEQPILVSRLQGSDFVRFKLVDSSGNEVPWHGEAPAHPRAYASDFTVLRQYQAISTHRIVSLKDGAGFALHNPGQYTLTAEFSMGSPENLLDSQAKRNLQWEHSLRRNWCFA
jgi:hypothetical protein